LSALYHRKKKDATSEKQEMENEMLSGPGRLLWFCKKTVVLTAGLCYNLISPYEETGEIPVRARRRKAHDHLTFLPEAAIRGQAIGACREGLTSERRAGIFVWRTS
jgi:hypothetical protein